MLLIRNALQEEHVAVNSTPFQASLIVSANSAARLAINIRPLQVTVPLHRIKLLHASAVAHPGGTHSWRAFVGRVVRELRGGLGDV